MRIWITKNALGQLCICWHEGNSVEVMSMTDNDETSRSAQALATAINN